MSNLVTSGHAISEDASPNLWFLLVLQIICLILGSTCDVKLIADAPRDEIIINIFQNSTHGSIFAVFVSCDKQESMRIVPVTQL
jgi:hypothetical protein